LIVGKNYLKEHIIYNIVSPKVALFLWQGLAQRSEATPYRSRRGLAKQIHLACGIATSQNSLKTIINYFFTLVPSLVRILWKTKEQYQSELLFHLAHHAGFDANLQANLLCSSNTPRTNQLKTIINRFLNADCLHRLDSS